MMTRAEAIERVAGELDDLVDLVATRAARRLSPDELAEYRRHLEIWRAEVLAEVQRWIEFGDFDMPSVRSH